MMFFDLMMHYILNQVGNYGLLTPLPPSKFGIARGDMLQGVVVTYNRLRSFSLQIKVTGGITFMIVQIAN